MIINLLKETVLVLQEFNLSIDDVMYVCDNSFWCTWKEFEQLADIEYDEGFGAAEINLDLKIVGNNWWLERYEYDGAEAWRFKELPFNLKRGNVEIKKRSACGNYLNEVLND